MTIRQFSSCPSTRRSAAGKALLAPMLGLFLGVLAAAADARSLTDISYATQPGNQVVVSLTFDEPVDAPQSFTISDPARIAVDLAGTSNQVKDRNVSIGVGVVESVSAVEAGGRTRVVVKLSRMIPYDIQTAGNTVRLVLDQHGSTAQPAMAGTTTAFPSAQTDAAADYSIDKIDFRRTPEGAGQVVVKISDPSLPINIREEGGKVIAEFQNTRIPPDLERRLDVTDFATPIQTIDLRRFGNSVRLVVDSTGNYDELAYQAGDVFVVEVKPLTPEEQEQLRQDQQRYVGERLSLNFQDIEVRSVLQLIADFTGLNVVVSDSVTGNITLRLQDVPWDQALDIILKTKGLDKRQQGNVMLVAPADELATRERLQLEAQKQLQQLAPVRSDFIQVNYAKAADMAELIRSKDASLLSERGTVKVDARTNTLIVQDTDRNLSEIRSLVARLDVPVRQVLIESRVVIARDDFARDLGVRFGYSRAGSLGDMGAVIGGTRPGAFTYDQATAFSSPPGSGNEGLLVDLPVTSPSGAIGLAVGRLGSYLLQLELSAMETEGRGTIVSSPRVITANQKAATIEQGVEIPYLEASSSGAATVSFKKAVLGLTVTPQITPDDRVLLDLEVSKDSRGEVVNGTPSINTQSVTTQVLVDNGETIVLGGVFERTNTNSVERIPIFGELPIVGHLFRSTTKVDNRSELLIFVTPKILRESLSTR